MIVKFDQDQLRTLCREHSVLNLWLFGSVIRPDFKEGSSDIDVLVEFKEVTFDRYFSFLEGLRSVLNVQNIDLVTVDSLKNQVIKEEILSTRESIYAA